jgi:hypothetical protein
MQLVHIVTTGLKWVVVSISHWFQLDILQFTFHFCRGLNPKAAECKASTLPVIYSEMMSWIVITSRSDSSAFSEEIMSASAEISTKNALVLKYRKDSHGRSAGANFRTFCAHLLLLQHSSFKQCSQRSAPAVRSWPETASHVTDQHSTCEISLRL